MQRQNEIPVFFAIDEAYAPCLSVALHSAVQNASPDRHYRAIVLHQGLREITQARLRALGKPWFPIDMVPMESGLESITDRMSNRLRCDYFTLTIYFRLFIPEMFPQYQKGIYIDSDVVVKGDLAELFETDLGAALLGACADKSVVEVPELAYYMEEGVGVERHSYINSGVLLMDLEKLRQRKLGENFLRLLNTYHVDCIAPDQDYINAMCAGQICYLPEAWDAMPNEGQPPLEDPKIIHYNLFSKPWCYDDIQYSADFWHYAAGSGYLSELQANKAAYGEEQKQADRACLELLVRRGAQIPGQEITFKKLTQRGEKIRL